MAAVTPETAARHMPVVEGYPRPQWAAIDESIATLPVETAHDCQD